MYNAGLTLSLKVRHVLVLSESELSAINNLPIHQIFPIKFSQFNEAKVYRQIMRLLTEESKALLILCFLIRSRFWYRAKQASSPGPSIRF